MELHHIDHIARTAAAMINSSQITLSGNASLFRTVRVPSSALGVRLDNASQIDVIIYENHDPEGCIDLLNETMGEHSSFHHKYGYHIWAQASWDVILPTNWTDRLEYLNASLSRAPHLLAVSPCDIILANLATSPDPVLNMDLMLGGVTSAQKLLTILDKWDIPAEKKRPIRNEILAADITLRRIDQESDSQIQLVEGLTAGNIIPITGRGSRRRVHA